jgi:D-glycero-D-manno-heptose 1,7-bisphosphate phosphatase
MSVVMIMGFNGGGKTTLMMERFPNHERLNRDIIGGKLSNLPRHLEVLLNYGHTDIVLDNTYADVESRAGIIAVCKQYDVDCECVWLDASIEDAQVNACQRMIGEYGHVIPPEGYKRLADPNTFPIAALYSYRKRFEKPTKAEGFSSVEKVKFVRVRASTYKNKAIILDYDGTLRESTGPNPWPEDPDHVVLMPGRTERLQEYIHKGYHLLGASNQSAIAKGTLSAEVADVCFERTNELLGIDIDVTYCPHKVPPISCYCRKPGVGLGVAFIEKYKLSPAECIMVGDRTSDKTFAKRCGFQYQDQAVFFK